LRSIRSFYISLTVQWRAAARAVAGRVGDPDFTMMATRRKALGASASLGYKLGPWGGGGWTYE